LANTPKANLTKKGLKNMKNLMKIFICGMFLFIPAFIFGQGSGSSNYPQPRNEGGSAENNNFVVTRSISGKVASLEKGILIIKDKKDKEIQVILTKETKFKIGKKTVKADELDEKMFAEGNDIKVTYVPNLKNPKEFYAVEVRFSDKSMSKEKPVLTKT
jgi:hypothetical protein